MLTLTLKGLERDGLISRTVYSTIPPRIDYELTKLGRGLLIPVTGLGDARPKTGRDSGAPENVTTHRMPKRRAPVVGETARIEAAVRRIGGLNLRDAAVYEQFRSRDIAAVVRCEKYYRLCDLIGPAEPAERNAFCDHLLALLAGF